MAALEESTPLYRLRQVEHRADRLDDEKADLKDFNQIATEVRNLRRTLMQFMVTIASSSVIFAFTVLELHK